MAQTSNAIDRRFSTPYYTNTNYSYIKSKPNGAFSAASCFGRSGCWGSGGSPNGVVRERLLIWQSLPKTGNYSSFVFRRVASAEVFDHLYAYRNWQTNSRGTNSSGGGGEGRSRSERRKSSTQTVWCTSTAVFHKIGRQKYLRICFVLKDRNRKREEAEEQNMQEDGKENFFS